MIICKKCGSENEEGAMFCGSCGAFLEWAGEKIEENAVLDLTAIEEEKQAEMEVVAAEPEAISIADEAPAPSQKAASVKSVAVDAPPTAPPEVSFATDPAVTEKEIQAPPTIDLTEAESASKAATKQQEPPAVEKLPPAEVAVPPSADVAVEAAPKSGLDATTTEKEAAPSDAPPAQKPSEADAKAQARRARALIAKPVKPTRTMKKPPPDQPAARKPEPTKIRPAPILTPAGPTREIKPGDLICGECGEGNDPMRKFCRRCGGSLITATVALPPPLPWWKRIFRRQRKTLAAGERPGRGGVSEGRVQEVKSTTKRAAGIAIKLGLLGAVAIGGVIGVPKLIEFVSDIIRDTEPAAVASVDVSSNSATKERLVDGKSDTAWSEAARTNGVGETLTFGLDRSYDLVAIGFHIKADGPREPRPNEILISFYDPTGNLIDSETPHLTDTDEFQEVRVNERNVAKVTVKILSVHPSVNGRGTKMSISEVEFFARKGA